MWRWADTLRLLSRPARGRKILKSVALRAERAWSAPWTVRYSLALTLASVTIAVRLALTPLWGPDVRLIMFVPAVLLAGWFGGAGAACLTTVSCAAATAYFWLAPIYSFRIADPEDTLDLGMFLVVGIFCGAVIEALHQTRRTVERHSAELSGLLAERSRLIEAESEARQAAEAANRTKDEFFATIAHELRNPLAAITAAAGMLDRSEAAEETVRPRQVIVRQAAHLGRMVDDLLDVGRVISGKIRLRRERLDLAVTVRRCVRSVEETGKAADHRLTMDLEPAWTYADPLRVEQIVMNLLVNAAKYTPRGGSIHVSVHARGTEAVLQVRDTGIGIPADLLPHVFDLFVQGKREAERSQGGLGIGLSVVRRLVELHSGSIRVVSEGQGRGTLFSVWLPADEPAAVPELSRAPGRKRVNPVRPS